VHFVGAFAALNLRAVIFAVVDRQSIFPVVVPVVSVDSGTLIPTETFHIA
jgi:hypothetical protein